FFDFHLMQLIPQLVHYTTLFRSCLLDHKDGVLYSGDTNNGLVQLHPPDALPLEVYLQSLEKLANRIGFHTLYPGHDHPFDWDFIREQFECVIQIISGERDDVPYEYLSVPPALSTR